METHRFMVGFVAAIPKQQCNGTFDAIHYGNLLLSFDNYPSEEETRRRIEQELGADNKLYNNLRIVSFSELHEKAYNAWFRPANNNNTKDATKVCPTANPPICPICRLGGRQLVVFNPCGHTSCEGCLIRITACPLCQGSTSNRQLLRLTFQ